MNVKLVQSIKTHLADQTSDELRTMLEARDVDRYSPEAFAAAQEVLGDRARGASREPPPKPPPPPEPTPAQRAAAADSLLRRQVRLVGTYHYCLALFCLLMAAAFTRLSSNYDYVAFAALLGACFGWLGWSLRRFSPTARVVAMLFGACQIPAFPIGTVIGLYCIDKLTRADYLFGVKPHPGERDSDPRGR